MMFNSFGCYITADEYFPANMLDECVWLGVHEGLKEIPWMNVNLSLNFQGSEIIHQLELMPKYPPCQQR